MPDAFWAHRRAAHREDLLAFRSIVDACIRWLEEPSPAERATRIEFCDGDRCRSAIEIDR